MAEDALQHLHLTAHQIEVLRRAAAGAYPRECCGLLIGDGEAAIRVTEIVPTTNVAEDPARTFAIDPQQQFDALRTTRANGRRVVGHYHSHPDGPPAPSARDLAMAHDFEAVWVVVSASPAGASAPRAFRRSRQAEGFVEVPLALEP